MPDYSSKLVICGDFELVCHCSHHTRAVVQMHVFLALSTVSVICLSADQQKTGNSWLDAPKSSHLSGELRCSVCVSCSSCWWGQEIKTRVAAAGFCWYASRRGQSMMFVGFATVKLQSCQRSFPLSVSDEWRRHRWTIPERPGAQSPNLVSTSTLLPMYSGDSTTGCTRSCSLTAAWT